MEMGTVLLRAVVVLAVCGGIAASATDSLSSVALGVAPPIVDLSVPPGKTHTMDLKVYNKGDSPVHVRAYVSALELGADGSPVPQETAKGKWSCAEWITLDEDQFELGPGQEEEVQATLRVPQGTSGGRYAAILFEATPTLTNPKPWDVAIGTRVGTIVLETIPHTLRRNGEIDTVKVIKSTGQGVSVAVSFHNTGNVHLKARGSVIVRNEKRRIVDRFPLEVGTGTVLPDGRREFWGSWSNTRKMDKGDYTGEARVTCPGMGTTSETFDFRIQ